MHFFVIYVLSSLKKSKFFLILYNIFIENNREFKKKNYIKFKYKNKSNCNDNLFVYTYLKYLFLTHI